MMKKKFLAIAFMSFALVLTACDKDEKSDYEKGREDGQAFCKCMNKTNDENKCYDLIDASKINDNEDPTKWTEYQQGFIIGSNSCMGVED
jgi:hypothetical protein